MANDFYSPAQISSIKKLADSMCVSITQYDAAWTRAIELLGLPKPPAAEPVRAPALDLSDRDLNVLLSALSDAVEGWSASENEVKVGWHKKMFADLKRDGTSLFQRVQEYQKRQRDADRKDESRYGTDVELAIADMARFFVVSYGQMYVPGLTELWDRVGITADDRQNLIRLIGHSISTSILSPEHKIRIARLYLAAYQYLDGMEFRKIVKNADLKTERYSELFKAAKILVREGA